LLIIYYTLGNITNIIIPANLFKKIIALKDKITVLIAPKIKKVVCANANKPSLAFCILLYPLLLLFF
jgi:hypothetical protein